MNRNSESVTAEAVFAALDWLEAHPDKSNIGSMALNSDRRVVHPTHPDAECFCFVGRVAKEIGADNMFGWDTSLAFDLRSLGLIFSNLLWLNDNNQDPVQRIAALRGHVNAIANIHGWFYQREKSA